MFLRSAIVLLSVAALARTASAAALTSAQVVVNINIVTTLSGQTNEALVALPAVPTFKDVRRFSTSLVTSFSKIIQDVSGDITAMQSTPAFSDADATPVVDALITFVEIHQALLATVIRKHTVFAQFSLTAPVTAVLRSLEGVVDVFAFSMIALIPTKQSTVKARTDALNLSLVDAINAYNQICIPSLLYPTLQPICVDL